MARNYRQEYDRYQGTTAQKKRRAARNTARRRAEASGAVSRGDGKDIHHRDGNPRNNNPSNLQVRSASQNRSFARTSRGRKA